MRAVQLIAMISLVTGMMAVAVPSSAEALLRVGADVRWVPLSVESMEQNDQQLQPDRRLDSAGVGARALVGLEYLSVGGRLNFTRHAYDDEALSFSQLDLNAHVRSGIPLMRMNLFAEAGPTVALDIGEVGFNAGVGAEVDILGWPLIDMNLGLAAQYAYVPIGVGPDEVRVAEGLRGMVTFGVDFALSGGD